MMMCIREPMALSTSSENQIWAQINFCSASQQFGVIIANFCESACLHPDPINDTI